MRSMPEMAPEALATPMTHILPEQKLQSRAAIRDLSSEGISATPTRKIRALGRSCELLSLRLLHPMALHPMARGSYY